jgi:disulfide bond formation protein DsbB
MPAPLPVSEAPQLVAPVPPKSVLLWNVAALLLAVLAVAGSLWLSLGMQLKACPLCYYQRSFVMGAAVILLMAQLTDIRSSASVSVLAMPLAVAGLGVAGYHVSLELAGKLECPEGIFGLGTAPQQSLAAHGVLVLLLLVAGIRRPVLPVGMALGALLAFAAVQSAAPLPPPAAEEYKKPPVICRPPPPVTPSN